MRRKTKKILSVILTAVMLLTLIPFAYAANTTRGQIGDNAYWEYDETTKTMYITGEGPMWDGPRVAPELYTGDNIDYYYYNFEHLVIGDGITKIGAGSFYDNDKLLKDIHFGSGVEEIGKAAFIKTVFLENLVIPGNIKKIGEMAFMDSIGLRSVILEEGVETIGTNAFTDSVTPLEELVIPSTVTDDGEGSYLIITEGVKVTNNSSSAVVGFLADESTKVFYSREYVEFITKYRQAIQYYMLNGFENANEEYGFSFSSFEDIDDWFNEEFANNYTIENSILYYDDTFPESVQIYCLPDSEQHENCKSLKIPHYFTDYTCDLECGIHVSVSEDNYFAPTCTENGYEGGKVCTECLDNATTPEEEEAAILEAPSIIPAKGHTIETIKGVLPTCNSTGLTDGSYCKICGEIFIAQETISALGHTDKNNDGYCDSCGTDIRNADDDSIEIISPAERIINFFRGIVNAILALFKRVFG